MKNHYFLALLLCLLIASCTPVDYSHVEVYNSSNQPVSAIVNNDLYNLKPKEVAYIASEKRAQLFEYAGEKQLVQTRENERFLINLQQDTIIKMELHYGISNGGEAAKTKIPYKMIKLRDKKYFVPVKVDVGNLVIRNYDFSINEAAPIKISSDSDLYKAGNYMRRWTEYYMLYTVSEFIKSNRPLNRDQSFVESIMSASLMLLDPDYSFEINNEGLIPKYKGEGIGHLGRLRVSNDDVLEIIKPSLHNPARDGNIKKVIAKIPLCNLYVGGEDLQKNVAVDVVMTDNTHNPKLVIR